MERHDYVIVGAGSAGCALAGRLSEDPETRVLLLEAGGRDDRLHIRMPAAFTKLFKGPCDWNYSTAPQRPLGDRELYWPTSTAGARRAGATTTSSPTFAARRPAPSRWAGSATPTRR